MKWLRDNAVAIVIALMGAVVSVGTVAITFAGERATLKLDVARNAERIKSLESLNAEQTKWRVEQLEKRADVNDATLKAVADKLNTMLIMVERIDQRTSQPRQPAN